MARKRQEESKSVPEWVVTYGDLMSLLLCFFILLAAFSELKQERDYLDVLNSIKEAFGFDGGVGPVPNNANPDNSTIRQLLETRMIGKQNRPVDISVIESQIGPRTKVTTIHEGLKFAVGGAVSFEVGSAEIKPDGKDDLRRIAELIRGKNNRVIVRGHAFGLDNEGQGAVDYDTLSFQRARAVKEFLSLECDVRPERLSCEARGNTEPAEVRRYDAEQQAVNRRVEIIVTEVMINETADELAFTDDGYEG